MAGPYKIFPADLKILQACRPIFETLPGWSEDISEVTEYKRLPLHTRNYLDKINALVETPIDLISVGPGRQQTIVVNNPLA